MTSNTQENLSVTITGLRAADAGRAVAHLLKSMGADVTITDAGAPQTGANMYSYETPLVGVTVTVTFAA